MEGRKAAAVALCCILILISGELQQVAAMSKFCRCYKQCYPDCRMSLPPFTCITDCFNQCIPIKKVATGDCNRFCLFKICGTALDGEIRSILETLQASCCLARTICICPCFLAWATLCCIVKRATRILAKPKKEVNPTRKSTRNIVYEDGGDNKSASE